MDLAKEFRQHNDTLNLSSGEAALRGGAGHNARRGRKAGRIGKNTSFRKNSTGRRDDGGSSAGADGNQLGHLRNF